MSAALYRMLMASRSRGAPAPPLLLDTITGAAYAWSMRKLRAAYSGPAIRVRRSSDNAVQDVGFDGSGQLDTTALLAFAGAGSAFIRTWYDQVGSNDLLQTTSTLQPRIVDAGVLDVFGSRPYIVGDNSDDRLALTAPFSIQEARFTYSAVLRRRTTAAAIAGLSAMTSARSTLLAWTVGDELYVNEGRMTKTVSQAGSGRFIVTTQWDLLGDPNAVATLPLIRMNGSDQTVVQHTTGVFDVPIDGAMRYNNSNGASGSLAEHIYFSRLLTGGEISALEADQNAFYSIF